MAPEQIEGKEVDARTDIFAFGCVLYELLTGKRAFEGKSASTVMASVLAMTPQPIGELIPLTPPALERIVSRCLAKDPDERWQTIRDVARSCAGCRRAARRWVCPRSSRRSGRRGSGSRGAWRRCGARRRRVCGRVDAPRARAATRRALRVDSPENLSAPSPPVVSPDGRVHRVCGDGPEGKRLIWVRALDAVTPRALAGTDDVLRPFWSPDSKSLAFVGTGKLQRIDIAGGLPQVLCDCPGARTVRGAPKGSFSSTGAPTIRSGACRRPVEWRRRS